MIYVHKSICLEMKNKMLSIDVFGKQSLTGPARSHTQLTASFSLKSMVCYVGFHLISDFSTSF